LRPLATMEDERKNIVALFRDRNRSWAGSPHSETRISVHRGLLVVAFRMTGRRQYHAHMGFNPFRKQRRSIADIAMVVGAIAATIAGLIWAMSGS
jgi:hypothetical protein